MSKATIERCLPVSRLRELFTYDPISGDLRWRARPPRMFKHPGQSEDWNKRWAGSLAGYEGSRGYMVTVFPHKGLSVRRIAWAMHYGAWPQKGLFCRDGDPFNTRIANLYEGP